MVLLGFEFIFRCVMRKISLILMLLNAAVLLGVHSLLGQANDGPVLLPHKQTAPKPPSKPASSTLLVSCDMACKWSLDGKSQPELALAGIGTVVVDRAPHLLVVTSTDEMDVVRKLVDVTGPRTVVMIELLTVREKRIHGQQEMDQQGQNGKNTHRGELEREAVDRRVLNNDAVWTDSATGLMWSKKDNGQDLNWNNATSYCRDLHLAGYTDWRLPDISELQGLYDSSIQEKGYGDCSYCPMHIKGGIKLSDFQWSKTPGGFAGLIRTFNFINGMGGEMTPDITTSRRALCVRNPAQ